MNQFNKNDVTLNQFFSLMFICLGYNTLEKTQK